MRVASHHFEFSLRSFCPESDPGSEFFSQYTELYAEWRLLKREKGEQREKGAASDANTRRRSFFRARKATESATVPRVL